MLTLIIFTVLGIFAFRRVLISKGYATKRIQFYPVAILAAVLVPSSAAALFLDWAVSHNHCSDSSRGLIVIVIDILAFILYFGALHRAYANLKQLPSLLSPPPDLPK